MKIELKDNEVILREVYSGIDIDTDQGHFGIAQRDDGIEVMLNGHLVWSSTSALGNAPVSAERCHAAWAKIHGFT